MSNSEKFSQSGAIVGTSAWLILVYLMGSEFACVKSHSCSAGDFVLGAVVAIGFIAPAYILAEFISGLNKS